MTYDKLQGSCVGKDPNLWFPEGPSNATENSTAYAKAICNTCPIKLQCLQDAIENEYYGIWGGLTETERSRMKRTKSIAFPISSGSLRAGVEANKQRTIQASQKAVALIQEALDKLSTGAPPQLLMVPPQLLMAAQLRVANPDLNLQELADLSNVTKDTYAGILRRFMQLAKKGTQ